MNDVITPCGFFSRTEENHTEPTKEVDTGDRYGCKNLGYYVYIYTQYIHVSVYMNIAHNLFQTPTGNYIDMSSLMTFSRDGWFHQAG